MRRILVADGEEEVCLNTVRLMSPTGVEVEYAANGEGAFDMLYSARGMGRPYDMVLLDWKMPRLGGLETAP